MVIRPILYPFNLSCKRIDLRSRAMSDVGYERLASDNKWIFLLLQEYRGDQCRILGRFTPLDIRCGMFKLCTLAVSHAGEP
jgi:hypothetical protein